MLSKLLRVLAASSLTLGMLPSAASAQSRLERVTINAIGPVPTASDTATEVRKATAVCSARRLCKKGWDLAVLRVVGPKTGAAVGQATTIRVAMTNFGRVPTPQVPVRIDFANATERVMTPEIEPSDTVTVGVRIVPQYGGGVAEVMIDPEHLAGDTLYVGNNEAQSEHIAVEASPTLELAEFANTTSSVRNRAPLQLTLRIRNASKAYTLTDAVLVLDINNTSCFGEVTPRVAIPALGPQQELSAVVLVTEVSTLSANPICQRGASARLYGEIRDARNLTLLSLTELPYTVR